MSNYYNNSQEEEQLKNENANQKDSCCDNSKDDGSCCSVSKNEDKSPISIEEYHQNNMMIFNIKDLHLTNTSICTLSSIDRFTMLPNGIEQHECKKSELTEDFIEVVKRNLILSFFEKIEIEPFDPLDVQTDVDFLFE